MDLNPMDGFRDIHPYPWEWSREIASSPLQNLSTVEFVYDNLDFWTYNNHWSFFAPLTPTPSDHCTDVYWSDEGEERLQLPPPVGDHVASLLRAQVGDEMRCMIWFHQIYRPLLGWMEYDGEQGTFVDHIHIEWRED